MPRLLLVPTHRVPPAPAADPAGRWGPSQKAPGPDHPGVALGREGFLPLVQTGADLSREGLLLPVVPEPSLAVSIQQEAEPPGEECGTCEPCSSVPETGSVFMP